MNKLILKSLLPPANIVCEGYVFTGVFHSVHRGGMHGRGACMVGGVHGMECAWWGGGMHGGGVHGGEGACMVGVCMAGGCVWQGVHGRGMHGRGDVWWEACVAGEHVWQGVCMAGGACMTGVCMAGCTHDREVCMTGEISGGLGGVHGCSGGHACVVAPGGHVWLLLGGVCGCSRGHAWLLPGGVHGCSQGGMHSYPQEACMVARRGHVWLLPGGHAWDKMRYGDTINQWSVRILLECILVVDKFMIV